MGLRTPLLWLLFLAWIVGAAALMSSPGSGQRLAGTILVVLLASALAGLALMHYFSQRRRAQSRP